MGAHFIKWEEKLNNTLQGESTKWEKALFAVKGSGGGNDFTFYY